MRWGAALGTLLLCVGWGALPARAEYRAYEIQVVDLHDCRINKREQCKTQRVTTAMTPDLYQRTHGGEVRIGVQLIATWRCYGDTSYFEPVCPRPPANDPKFSLGDEVEVALQKHITEGWKGTVEVAYYQSHIRSNVYGVRFPNHKNVYARYFEKDLKKSGAPEGALATPPR